MFNSFSARSTPSNLCRNSLFRLNTKIAFLTCELFLISKARLLDSIEFQLGIFGASDRLKGIFEKYHSPLNNNLLFI